MSQKDIIRWVIDCMLAHDDSITQELALTVEREARAEWGGQRIEYVPKTCDRKSARRPLSPEAKRAVYEDGIKKTPAVTVMQEHGISRTTLYRLMKRGPSS